MKKIYKGTAFSALTLTMVLTMMPVSAFAAEGVQINEANFPDASFRRYVSDKFDSDGNGFFSDKEIVDAKELYIFSENISSVKGLEYFTALESLGCSGCNITSLDLSQNTALMTLYCEHTKLTSLDLSHNTALKKLNCYDNQLTSINLSQNTALTSLYCSNNRLTSIDLSQNTALTRLNCTYNQLTSLDVSQNTALTGLECSENQLTSLDVSQNTALELFDCSFNQLSSIDISKCAALAWFHCYNNQLTYLDVSKNTALESLMCFDNWLTSLDLSQNTVLKYLYCDNNDLSSLDLSNTDVIECTILDNELTVAVDRSLIFDLSTLPGFDVSKASNWTGGTVSGNILTVNSDATEVSYTYDCGKNISETFYLWIMKESQPVIIKHPTDVSVPIGSKASVSIETTGSGQKYTWYYKDVNSSSFSKSANTASTYSATMCAAMNGRQVFCVVEYENGDLLVSNPVTLKSMVDIKKQPVDAAASIGSTVSASVNATGNGLKYEWYYKDVNGSSFLKSANKTSAYSAKMSNALNGRQIYCVVTDENGNSVKSNTVTLKSKVNITKQPSNVSVTIGSTASASVSATGSGLKYTWYYKDINGSAFVKSANKASAYSAKMSNALNGRQVYCIITDQNGYYTISNTVTLKSKVTITKQPVNSIAAIGSTASASVSATGSGLKYTWYYKDVNSSSFLRSANKTSTYSAKMSNALNGRQVYCVITDQNGNSVKSNTVTLKKK